MGRYMVVLICFPTFLFLCSYVTCENSKSQTSEQRASTLTKRSVSQDLQTIEESFLDDDNDQEQYGIDREYLQELANIVQKRRPGWGKRNFNTRYELAKRKPGWGKRSGLENEDIKRVPGWGKRNKALEEGFLPTEIDKRRPGWGKRSEDSYNLDKRKPGWGKRAPRPGWGKRNVGGDRCSAYDDEITVLEMKIDQIKSEKLKYCDSSIYMDEDTAMDV